MTTLEQATVYAAEVRVAAWNENKDGLFVRLELETSDVHPFKHEQGQRFMMVCTRIGNDEQPDPNKPARFDHKKAYAAKSEGEQAVARAGILCDDPLFVDWIKGLGWLDTSRQFLLDECAVKSRADLASNALALKYFLNIEQDYREATGQTAEPRG